MNLSVRTGYISGPTRARRRPTWCAVTLVVAALTQIAYADEPAKPLLQPAAAAPGEDKTGTEVGLLPLIGGDTDNGFGVGAIGSVASFDATHSPYKWQLQFATFIATKSFPSPSYEDGFVNLIAPQMLDGKLRLEIRPSFTRETALRFYGLGNNVTVTSGPADPTRDFYSRLHPQLAVLTRWKLDPESRWSVIGATQYLYNRIAEDPTSTLGMMLATIDPKANTPHSVLRLETGAAYDSRDNEIAPTSGMFHTFEIRMSPHLGSEFPYQYEQADIQLRFYRTVRPGMVLAWRLVGDFMLGDVPFYELSRYEDTSAIGGSLGVRGVPGYTFYGKVKAFGNVELRTAITNFSALDRKFKFGVATFFDAGRIWSDLRNSRPDLDGTGLGLHYGIGAGIRLQQGRAFLVRADLAWSPDASPIAGYVLADHIF